MDQEIMEARIVIGLIGEQEYTDLIASLPHEFFKLPGSTRTSFWYAIHDRINSGETESKKLAQFAGRWMAIYLEIKTALQSWNKSNG